jgi:hypothetical protein
MLQDLLHVACLVILFNSMMSMCHKCGKILIFVVVIVLYNKEAPRTRWIFWTIITKVVCKSNLPREWAFSVANNGGTYVPKGISNGPTQMDRGRSIRSVFDRAREKPSPAARHIFIGLFAVTQMRPKFGRGLHRRGLTAVSARVLLLSPRGPCVIHHGRFISSADSVAYARKGYLAASTYAPSSIAPYH